MIPKFRKQYNHYFSDFDYQEFLRWIARQHAFQPNFRIAETPVFIPSAFKAKLFRACEEIIETILRPDFKAISDAAILPHQRVPGEDEHTHFLQMDFGICRDEHGELIPQLIETQGFPSLYFFQDFIANAYKKHFRIPENFHHLFGGLSSQDYYQKLKRIILGDKNPENVILLEVEPSKQDTQIDFIIAEHLLGIRHFCVTDLITEGKDVYYRNDAGKKIKVERIFNRVIFDELEKRSDLERSFFFTQESNVEWAGHPNWFFRISKHTLPFLNSEFVPETHFLSDLKKIPADLENYVLKPLYSFAGAGVILNPSREEIEKIEEKDNFILQRKVEYAPIIRTPSGPAKCEIRMLMLWEPGQDRPQIVNNLARLSKGEMVGVKYNRDKDWVGGSVGFFERD